MQKESQTENEIDSNSLYSRIRKIFERDSVTSNYNPKLYLVSQCVFAGSLTGFALGGRIGARIGAVEHIESTKLAVYQSVVHAQREYQSKVFVGFVRNGCRFGWRAGVFSGLYSLLMVIFTETNHEHTGVNYLAAGACTGIVYKSLSGWRSMVVGAIVGTGLSLPVATLTGLVNKFASDDVKEKLDVFGASPPYQPEENGITEEISAADDVPQLDDVINQLESTLNHDDKT